MREKREVSLTAKLDKFARFKQIASEDPSALADALGELSEAFSSLAESSEALLENLDLAPAPKEASIREKVASRKKFATSLKRFASEAPEKVEEAINEIYNAVDEVALALEHLSGNLGFELNETSDEAPEDEAGEHQEDELDMVVDPENGEDLDFQNEDGTESVAVPISFQAKRR